MMKISAIILLTLFNLAGGWGLETGGCLLAGTQISLPNGETVAIEALRVGDRILGWSPQTGLTPVKVLTIRRRHIDSYNVLKTAGATLHANGALPVHRTFQKTGALDSLSPNEELWVLNGTSLTASPITSLRDLPASLIAFSIGLAGPHSFFAETILVHD